MTRAGKVKRYWSGIKNVRKRLIRDDKIGQSARKEFYERTGKKKYQEKEYQKRLNRGRSYLLKETRKDFTKIQKDRNAGLKKEFKRLKKEGKVKGNFRDFKRANTSETDYVDIIELFNSP